MRTWRREPYSYATDMHREPVEEVFEVAVGADVADVGDKHGGTGGRRGRVGVWRGGGGRKRPGAGGER